MPALLNISSIINLPNATIADPFNKVNGSKYYYYYDTDNNGSNNRRYAWFTTLGLFLLMCVIVFLRYWWKYRHHNGERTAMSFFFNPHENVNPNANTNPLYFTRVYGGPNKTAPPIIPGTVPPPYQNLNNDPIIPTNGVQSPPIMQVQHRFASQAPYLPQESQQQAQTGGLHESELAPPPPSYTRP